MLMKELYSRKFSLQTFREIQIEMVVWYLGLFVNHFLLRNYRHDFPLFQGIRGESRLKCNPLSLLLPPVTQHYSVVYYFLMVCM